MATYYGSDASDSIVGGTGDDSIHGGPPITPETDIGNDTLVGGAGRDTLFGYSGDDSLDGDAASDTLVGGAGNDVYFNPSGDFVDESTGAGIDTIITGGGNFSISTITGVENLTGIATTGQSFFGNSLDNMITCSVGNDTLNGVNGNDTLNGGAGADSMTGGIGNDTFVVDNAGDILTEVLNQGTDTVLTSLASYSLGTHLENLTGTANTGQAITGNTLSNVLTGDTGNDTLQGGLGNDSLFAGAGADTAAFSGFLADYAVTTGSDGNGGFTQVTDTFLTDGNDGTDRLYGAESLQFADQTTPICFYPGTLVRTLSGDAAVETLRIGDMVLTHAGIAAPVRWMGRQSIATRFADPLRALPIRIRAGALAEGLPERDLLVSPGHALLLDGVLVQAGALVNGSSIIRETNLPASFTYHHVELSDHSLILVEGVPAETFVDNIAREAFDNWAEHPALTTPMAELGLPRAMSHRQVPIAVREQLTSRAAKLAGNVAAAA